jgi:hypothetical protein
LSTETRVLSDDNEISKTSAKSNAHDFYPKHLNYAFMPKPDFERYRNDAKKSYEEEQDSSGIEEISCQIIQVLS